jgi:molybdate transport system regulatory protein
VTARKTSHASIGLTPRVMVEGQGVFGPGKADLLELIESTGSISAAAREMDMSYSRAWQLVDEMNHAFKAPLVEKSAGGKRGGGAQVTDAGREALALYRRMQKTLRDAAGVFDKNFAKLLK